MLVNNKAAGSMSPEEKGKPSMLAPANGDGTVGKALEVLDQVAAFGRPVRFSELLEQSSYPKATLYRLAQTLVSQGMLSLDPDRQSYALGVRLVRLAHAAWRQSSLAPIARVHIENLSQKLPETIHLAQLDGGQVLYVDKLNARQPVEMFSQAGKVGPAYCTGVGKAMLAFLPEHELAKALRMQSFHRFTAHTLTDEKSLRAELSNIRARGYAFDREEHETGIVCIAMPILNQYGRVRGALSVTGPTDRVSLQQLEAMAPMLADTAASIAQDAEDWAFPEHKNQANKKEA